MSPSADAVDVLLEESAEGVDFDGLNVEAREDGYALETPGAERSGLSAEELRAELEDRRPYVTNWRYWRSVGGHGAARRAFLRWCERAPLDAGEDAVADPLPVPARYDALAAGIERTWGQLAIATELAGDGSGDRIHRLRHVDDRGVGSDDDRLESLGDVRDLRELTTYDEDGRYRPLKTAPTLVSGWALDGLDGESLVEAVSAVYPATVANWHREARGELDVDHWLETAERQTGIYDVVDELPREAVEWMAEACCVDSQCCKRREWEYEDGDDLDVDGGDGVFPCREPCSVVIAAARKWAILESERERTWTVELTTSEKNQLEALLDAVAEGRVDEIREADLSDGANRYRARYLRAKRFADDPFRAADREPESPPEGD